MYRGTHVDQFALRGFLHRGRERSRVYGRERAAAGDVFGWLCCRMPDRYQSCICKGTTGENGPCSPLIYGRDKRAVCGRVFVHGAGRAIYPGEGKPARPGGEEGEGGGVELARVKSAYATCLIWPDKRHFFVLLFYPRHSYSHPRGRPLSCCY